MNQPSLVFVTGGSGYLGRALIVELLRRGHRVRALARRSSETRLPGGTEVVTGDALLAESFAGAIAPAGTIVHLVGTPRPSRRRRPSFARWYLASIRATVAAAAGSRARHLVYVSVAQPAPVMRAYIAARREGEALVGAAGRATTILRPWYVLGPGHWWPIALLPFYAVLGRLPATRAGAERLGLVTQREMVAALIEAIENPPAGIRIVEVPEIRRARATMAARAGVR